MKPIPIPVRPEPVEVEVVPVIEHRVQFDVGPDTVSVVLTGSLERKIAPPKRKTPAQVRSIAADKSRGTALDQPETWPCNDCGQPCPKWDELCGPCYEEQLAEEEWDLMHPETRCPPRE